MPVSNRKIILRSRPQGSVTRENFAVVEEAVGEPGERQVLVRNHFVSIDPYQRGRMGEEKSYAANMQVGDVIVAGTVGEVIASRSERFPVGEYVSGYLGWQEYGLAHEKTLQPVDTRRAPGSAYLGVLGLPGVTAWLGLHLIGEPKAGETVVVSAAAGAVGSVAAQIARLRGARRVVGIAGGRDKCAYLTGELGLDAGVDYRASTFRDQLAEATPDGVDVYFENVGGEVGDAVAKRLKPFARVPLCGLVSQYNGPPAPFHGLGAFLINRVRAQGFICTDHLDLWPRAQTELSGWLGEGRLTYRESVAQGLDAAPEAFIGMLAGRNLGKQLVKLI